MKRSSCSKRTSQRDNAGKTHGIRSQASSPTRRIWQLAAIYFCCMMGLYGISFWLPTLIKATGVKDALDVGLLTAIPYAVRGREHVPRRAQRGPHRERRWHFAIPAVLAGVGLLCQHATRRQHPARDDRADGRDGRHARDDAGLLDLSDAILAGGVGGGRHRA